MITQLVENWRNPDIETYFGRVI